MWRDPTHPWRLDPKFQLKDVPTLIRWEKGTTTAWARLENDEAHLGDKIDLVLPCRQQLTDDSRARFGNHRYK
jgi:hypothetical protein